ncbi:MAG: serine/threonine-protein kinase [Anaerobutyricum sp.]|nr:serine/threonine-protein kinase [Anaerobutyricum sp.]
MKNFSKGVTKLLKKGFVLDGKYRILSVIGQGGMSVVYLAMHEKLQQKWAIKEINKEHCENYGLICRRLISEANILKKLDHPGLPGIIDIIEEKNTIWLVMEYIEGRTLKEILDEQNSVPEKTAVEWGQQLCQVLSYLHGRTPPIIYRDLKPENIMIKKDGKLVLIDFGIAREYCYEKDWSDTTYLGTRGYAAPEQYGGMGQTDQRTDIYCFGMTLYHLTTGLNPEKPPFGLCPEEKWAGMVSEGMENLILKCTRFNPEDRYQNCEEVKQALANLKQGNQGCRYWEKQMKTVQIFFVAFVVILCSLITVWKTASEYHRKNEVFAYISRAEKEIDEKKTEENYKKALRVSPSQGEIYASMLQYYIKPNNFQIKDATAFLNILSMNVEGENILEIFKRKNNAKYVEFCYAMGTGYFYDMGGITGKKLAQPWFCDVEKNADASFDANKKKRAKLYGEICRYYNTFLEHGEDRSGERKKEDFYNFYRTLHKLNNIRITEKSSQSELASVCLISKEISIEILNYADRFLENNKITENMLQMELDKIESRVPILIKQKKKETEEIENFVLDAKRKVEALSYMK